MKKCCLLLILCLLLPVFAGADSLSVQTNAAGFSASPLLFGLFLEDINFAVDGLSAEMIRNGSFAFGQAAANGAQHGWSAEADVTLTVLDGSGDGSCLHAANPHYARIENISGVPAGILGNGFLDGLAVTRGEACIASLFLRAPSGLTGPVSLALLTTDGQELARADIPEISAQWRRYAVTLIPDRDADRYLRLAIQIPAGVVDCDMVSLCPADTFAGLPIRKDLGEMLSALRPAFLRFPGGCAVEGSSPESIYSWKDSIGNGETLMINGVPVTGDPAVRPQGTDIWSGTAQHPYYMSYSLGFYEYFLLCEALDCVPVPVLNAGMTCPVQSRKYTVYTGQELRAFIQDALDLAEFCRGDTSTKWGAVRAAMGHPDPFPLSLIAIGNEQWQPEYYAHYLSFVAAFEEAAASAPDIYGDIRLIVANGPAATSGEGWDYIDGYAGMEDTRTALVDEHYYMEPDWFLSHTDRYDTYPRGLQATVFLGEYAARSNRLEAALAEAAFMTGLERNSDVVSMACYAPLFGNATACQWTPDLIFFDRNGCFATVNYYVQQLFMTHRIQTVLPLSLNARADSVFASAGLSADGDLVLKLVNAGEETAPLSVHLGGGDWADAARLDLLAGRSGNDANTFTLPNLITPESGEIPAGRDFTYELPPYSLSVLTLSPAR